MGSYLNCLLVIKYVDWTDFGVFYSNVSPLSWEN